jgi:hypothetical protein
VNVLATAKAIIKEIRAKTERLGLVLTISLEEIFPTHPLTLD